MANKHTKKALFMSALSILLCLSMLVGSTFAWFTDTASTGVNTIAAGNLDVELEYSNDAMTSWTDAEKATEVFDKNDLWEPGFTKVVYFKVSNKGSLALKYQIGTNLVDKVIGKTRDEGKDIDLTKFIKFGIVQLADDAAAYSNDDAGRKAARAAVASAVDFGDLTSESYTLLKGENDVFAFVAWMPEETNNDANHNGKDIPAVKFGISVKATQVESEYDSFDNQYDYNAPYPVVTPPVDFEEKEETPVDPDVEPTDVVIKEGAVTVTVPAANYKNDTAQTYETNVVVKTTEETDSSATYDISVTITDGNKANVPLTVPAKIEIQLAEDLDNVAVTHNGADMSKVNSLEGLTGDQQYYYDAVTGLLTISSKTFSPFTVTYEANFVASLNGKGYRTLKAALDAAKADDTISLLEDAVYDFGTASNQTVDAKGVKIVGAYQVTFQGDGANNTFSNATFVNVTVVDKTSCYAEDSWEFGYLEMADITAEKVVFENGIMIDGTSSFTNCTFTGKTEDGLDMYGVWVNDGSAAFKSCTFTGTRGLKAHEEYGSEVTAVTVDTCTFVDLTQKPGIALGTLNDDTTVTIKDSTFTNTQPGDQKLYIYESDTNVDTFTFINENNTVLAQIAEGVRFENSKYYVGSKTGLINFAQLVNAGKTFSGQTVELEADVDLSGVEWTAMKFFAGTFDGKGKTISNLKDAALFGTISGEVKNLNLDGVTATDKTQFASFAHTVSGKVTNCNVSDVDITVTVANHGGAVAGFVQTVQSGAVIDGCKVSNVTIHLTDATNNCSDGEGGVINGVDAGATVQNCEFTNITLSAAGRIKRGGGIFGSVGGKVSSCIVNGVSLITTRNTDIAGGFVAGIGGGAEITDCVLNNVVVNGGKMGSNVGGVFGKVGNAGTTAITLKNITVNGLTLTLGNSKNNCSNIGGFIGQVDYRKSEHALTMENCHINGLDMALKLKTSGESPSAGFISSLNANANITNCSVSGKIDGTGEPLGVGGFLGDIGGYGHSDSQYTVNIKDSKANVAITKAEGAMVGGFVAYAGSYRQSMNLTLNFTNCEATGSFYGQLETGTSEVSTFTGCKVDGAAFQG